MAEEKPKRPPTRLYAVTLHNTAATGDLAEMKKVAGEAEQHLHDHGDVSAALEILKSEIAKLERKG